MRSSEFALITVLASILALIPATADAQLDGFVQSVRALADATQLAAPSRSSSVRAAAARMRAALAAWDQDIRALEIRTERELPNAPDDRAARLHVTLGVAYRARGRFADARREFDAADALQPASLGLQLLRALTFEAIGKHDEAAKAFKAAWNIDRNNPAAAYYLLRSAGTLSADDRERARAVLTGAYDRLRVQSTPPPQPPFLVVDIIPDTLSRTPIVADDDALQNVFALLRSGKYEDAIAAVRRDDNVVTTAATDSPRAMLARGQQDEASGRVTDARRAYEKALAGTLTGRRAVLVGIARLAQVDGDLTGAIEAFTRAVQIAPNDVNVHKELATTYAAQGEIDDALCELVAALLVDPRDAQAHAAIGQLQLDSGRSDAAIAAFTRALELAPDRYEVRYALATALERLGRTEDAARQREVYEQARRGALDQRRRDIATDVAQQESIRHGSPDGDAR